MQRLEGRIALVTGAGSGIGRAIGAPCSPPRARTSTSPTWTALLPRRWRRDRARPAARRARCAADVSRGQDVTAMFRAVEKAHGRLDVLVNNAGLNVRGDFRHL